MLTLFRKNTPLVWLLVLALLVLVRSVAFVYPVDFKAGHMPPEIQEIFSELGINLFLSHFISAILVLVQALMWQQIIKNHEVLYKLSYLPSVFYIMLCSVFSEQLMLTPQLIVNTLLLGMLSNVFSLYKSEHPFRNIFNAGFLLGVATLINIEVSLFMLLLLFGLNYFRPFNWRNNVGLFFSFLLPFYFAGAFFFLIERFEPFYEYYLSTVWLRFNKIEQAFEPRFLLVAGILLFILVIALVKLSNNFMKNTIKTRKSQFVTGLMFFLGLLVITAHSDQFFPNFTFLAPPLSLFAAYYFISPRRYIWKELLFLTLLGIILYFQWKPYFVW